MASSSDFEVDLTNCDREPIHHLGAIQPTGFLLALTGEWVVARASTNTQDFIGASAEDLIGASAVDVFAPAALIELRGRVTLLRGPDAVERVLSLALLRGKPDLLFDCAMHASGAGLILEAEPADVTVPGDAGSMMRAMMGRLDDAPDLKAFFREGARQVRALTGIDRVMVYRFDRDGSGEVVAEAVRSGIGSFLGLHYPASDIPQQARKLYLRTLLRIITDISATPVAIHPARDETGAPLDLSLSVLRSVSPIHIEYLKNMGVGASLSISIVAEGRLWGLFACHHYAPFSASFALRTIAELFGQMFALKLETRERAETASYEAAARDTVTQLLSTLASDVALLDNPEYLATALRSVLPCDGLCIFLDGRVAQSGMTPPPEVIPVIVRRLNAMAANQIFATDHLAEIVPQAEPFAAQAAGMLSLPLSRKSRDYVMLFRQERVRTVTWAGDPHKPASYGPNGARLTPRESFAEWSQEVRGRSERFTDAELRVAEALRSALLEVVLRLSDEATAERQRAAERQELLIAELNHRVRNILALIRGLVRQSRGAEAQNSEYIQLLDGRVEALARAHDQITQDNWGPAPLKPLIDAEASVYIGGQKDRIIIDGDPVLLAPTAYSSFALVVHELMTNSAKYGALSDSGSVSVAWRRDAKDNLVITWRERGGPAVKAPTRQGFGTTIIQRSIPHNLGGGATVDYKLTGLEAEFSIPARFISAPDEIAAGVMAKTSAQAKAPDAPDTVLVLGGTILLVEDSLLIAMDAEDMLMAMGAARVATAATVAQAMGEIDRERPNAAVLDVNLGRETSLLVADRLRSESIPYIFATGYGEQLQLPPEHARAPVIQKPYTAAGMAAIFAQLMKSAG